MFQTITNTCDSRKIKEAFFVSLIVYDTFLLTGCTIVLKHHFKIDECFKYKYVFDLFF